MKPASTAAAPTEEVTGASVLTPERIAELEAFDAGGERVLSVYLDLDPQRQARHAYRIVLEDLAKEIRSRLDRKERAAFEADVMRVQEWLDEHAPRGNGVALFSSEPRKFFQAHWLPIRVQDHLAWDLTPDVAPLLEVADEYERYAVALVEKDRARLFSVFMGAIEESDGLRDEEVPPRHDQGGVSQSHFQHHHDLHVLWHLKRVAGRLAALFRSRPFDRLILAGPEDVISELRPLLRTRSPAGSSPPCRSRRTPTSGRSWRRRCRSRPGSSARQRSGCSRSCSRPREPAGGRPAAWSRHSKRSGWVRSGLWWSRTAPGEWGASAPIAGGWSREPSRPVARAAARCDRCTTCSTGPWRARSSRPAGWRWSTATRRGVCGRRAAAWARCSASGQLSPQSWPEERTSPMASHRVVTNGVVFEVEDGRAPETQRRRRGRAAEVWLYRQRCEDVTIEYPGAGFIIRNTGTHRVRFVYRILLRFGAALDPLKLRPGESKRYLSGGYCSPTRQSTTEIAIEPSRASGSSALVSMRVSGGARHTPGD